MINTIPISNISNIYRCISELQEEVQNISSSSSGSYDNTASTGVLRGEFKDIKVGSIYMSAPENTTLTLNAGGEDSLQISSDGDGNCYIASTSNQHPASLSLTGEGTITLSNYGGDLRLNNGLILPTTNGDVQSVLNYYEEYFANVSYSLSGNVTITGGFLSLVRIGSSVTATITGVATNNETIVDLSSYIINVDTYIPVRFRPNFPVTIGIRVINNNQNVFGYATINSNGNIEISVAGDTNYVGFATGEGIVDGFHGFSMSWSIYGSPP